MLARPCEQWGLPVNGANGADLAGSCPLVITLDDLALQNGGLRLAWHLRGGCRGASSCGIVRESGVCGGIDEPVLVTRRLRPLLLFLRGLQTGGCNGVIVLDTEGTFHYSFPLDDAGNYKNNL